MNLIQPVACYLLVTILSACGSKPEARTPEDFIRLYSAAWANEDVDAIFELRARQDNKMPDPDPSARRAFEDSARASEIDAIRSSVQRRDLEYVAWTRTTFDGARDHGDHVHVAVRIDAARSEVVLVRNEGLLRIYPNPSLFQ